LPLERMNPMKRIALAAALVLLASPAAAQGIQSHIRYVEESQGISPFAGYMFIDPNLDLNDSTQVGLGLKSAPVFGLRYQIRVNGPLSLQASLGYIPTTRRVFLAEALNDSATIRAIDTGRDESVGVLLAETGFLFHLTGPRTYHNLAPFIGLNVGFARTMRDTGANDSTVASGERYRFGPAFAVGTKLGSDVFITRTLSLRAELDGRLWRMSAPAGFRANGQRKQSEWNNASSAEVGAVLHF
jgi:hypothetical protein